MRPGAFAAQTGPPMVALGRPADAEPARGCVYPRARDHCRRVSVVGASPPPKRRYGRSSRAPGGERGVAATTNKRLVRRFVAEVVAGDLAAAGRYLAPDLVNHSPAPGLTADRTGYMAWLARVRTVFPDLTVELEGLVAEGDLVAVRWRFTGTHRGPLPTPVGTVEPSGRRVQMTGMDFVRIRDGRMVERWTCEDELGLLRQLGWGPQPAG